MSVHPNTNPNNNFYLTVSPSTGAVLLVIAGKIIAFKDIKSLEQFNDAITSEISYARNLLASINPARISDRYANKVIADWENEVNRNLGLGQCREKNIDHTPTDPG